MSQLTAQPSLHVLTLTPFYPHKGNEADGPFVAEPLRYLSEFGVHSTVIAAKPISRDFIASDETEPRAIWVRHWQLPGRAAYASWGPMLYLRLAGLVRRLHRERRIDLIHAHCALPCGQPAAHLARDLGIPFVVTIHGMDAFSTGREQGLSRWWCDRASRRVYRRADQNICVSVAVQREIANVVGQAARTAVVYNGVDTELFKPCFDDEPAAPTILSVARLAPVKRLSLMLRAFAKVALQYPALRLEIVGEGQELDALTSLAAQLNIAERVAFLGRRSRQEVAQAMQRCTIFALPSQEEALGCVYLEAMATGKPIVACRNQAIAEIIRHGENGWLVEADEVDDLARGLTVLLDDASLRKRLGDAARPTMVEGFTLRHQAARLAQVYREALESKSSSNNI
ncbi:MAG: glycosyltransferase [Acidobacteria bacterium]|nr:glycosyltransferase [Acidobacteriota bacterium]